MVIIMYCKECGEEIQEDAKYCPCCGIKLINSSINEFTPVIEKLKKNSIPCAIWIILNSILFLLSGKEYRLSSYVVLTYLLPLLTLIIKLQYGNNVNSLFSNVKKTLFLRGIQQKNLLWSRMKAVYVQLKRNKGERGKGLDTTLFLSIVNIL